MDVNLSKAHYIQQNEIAHVFEGNSTFDTDDVEEPGIRTFMVVKQKNKRKLNTHLWFFGGFCKMINPRFVMLLDVGTGPAPDSLF
jgi:chitin synthase